jgi:ABC-2 type transport system permease protein
MSGWRSLLPNAWYVAIREYRSRTSSRSFLIGTVLLAAIAFAAAQAPVLIDTLVTSSKTRLEVVVRAADMPADAEQVLEQGLNGRAAASDSSATLPFEVSWLPAGDLDSAEQALQVGKFDGLLIIDRSSATASRPGDLSFTLKTDMAADGGPVRTIKSALTGLVIEDRLFQAGTSTQAILAPYPLEIASASPTSSQTNSISAEVSSNLISTLLIVLIFMAIITYGTWVAMSVAEEKGSRVMELMLNAATPLQMLAGKVVGNGAAGLTQYAVILGAAVVGVYAQGPVHELIAGDSGAAPSFGGLSPSVVAGFLILFVLGFAFYSLLYAALGSLVSRQEDVQSATSPLMVLIMVGYFASVAGLNAIDDTWVQVASFVPFFSPYLMLARIAVGHVAPWEFVLTVVILIASIGLALFAAARIYSAGVLLYGQRVSLRQVLKAARVSR